MNVRQKGTQSQQEATGTLLTSGLPNQATINRAPRELDRYRVGDRRGSEPVRDRTARANELKGLDRRKSPNRVSRDSEPERKYKHKREKAKEEWKPEINIDPIEHSGLPTKV